MAKNASQRRFGKRTSELGTLLDSKPKEFARVWATFVEGWLAEIHHRVNAQQSGDAHTRRLHIFKVLTQARHLAEAAGALSNRGVEQSLVVLRHECANAVAELTDRRLYDFKTDCTTRIRELSVPNRGRD